MGRPGDEAKRRRGWPGRPALSAPCANKPGLRFLGYIAVPTASPHPPSPSRHLATPLDLTPIPRPRPERAPVCTHTIGCTPNDIIVITHYLTSQATLQMILGSRARSAFHYGAAQILPRQRQQQQNGSAISDAICCSAPRVRVTAWRRERSITS